jgi:hypothetical protein
MPKSWLPVAAPLAVSDWPAQGFIVPRGPYALEYVPVAEHLNAEILSHPHLDAISAADRRRGALNLVANYLTLIRHDKLRAKAEAGPHPRVAALLAVIGDAELVLDDAQDHRFVMPGGPAGGTSARDPGAARLTRPFRRHTGVASRSTAAPEMRY